MVSGVLGKLYQDGEEIIRQGNVGESMYVVQSGRVEVTQSTGDGGEQHLAFIEAGNFFGEMSVFEKEVRSATVRAAGEARLKEAYGSYAVADKELETLIQADFLKIMIAERHFSGKEPLEKIATDLGITVELVRDTYGRMLQEVGISTATQFGKEHGTMDPDAPQDGRLAPVPDDRQWFPHRHHLLQALFYLPTKPLHIFRVS